MTKINIKALRIIALCVVLLLVSGFILFEVAAGQEKKERQKREVEPALAPASIMYPDVFKPSETDDDISYSLSSSGSFIIKDRTRNSDYVITPEGHVYTLLEDGSMTEVEKEEEKRIIVVKKNKISFIIEESVLIDTLKKFSKELAFILFSHLLFDSG